jgi:hypothetical protein
MTQVVIPHRLLCDPVDPPGDWQAWAERAGQLFAALPAQVTLTLPGCAPDGGAVGVRFERDDDTPLHGEVTRRWYTFTGPPLLVRVHQAGRGLDVTLVSANLKFHEPWVEVLHVHTTGDPDPEHLEREVKKELTLQLQRAWRAEEHTPFRVLLEWVHNASAAGQPYQVGTKPQDRFHRLAVTLTPHVAGLSPEQAALLTALAPTWGGTARDLLAAVEAAVTDHRPDTPRPR